MQTINFIVEGVPIGKGRPRAARTRTSVRLYTPGKTVQYEDKIASAGEQAMMGAPPFAGALAVVMDIHCPVPESWPAKKKEQALRGTLMPIKKPDIDNVEKAVFDGLNGVVWVDDCQVVDVAKRKRYSESPKVIISINTVASQDL